MIRIGLRDVRAHLTRFITSIIAIALGVAFVVGAFCFRDILENQVSSMLSVDADGDVYVRGANKNEEKSQDNSSYSSMAGIEDYNKISESLTDIVKNVSGVDSVHAEQSFFTGVLVGKDGTAVMTSASSTLTTVISEKNSWRSAHMIEGTYPKGKNEIVLEEESAKTAGLSVGDETTYVYPAGPETVKVTGIFSLDSSQMGLITVGLDSEIVKEVLSQTDDTPGYTSLITVYGNKNGGSALSAADQKELADAINAALPSSSNANAVTGDDFREQSTKNVRDQMGFMQSLILVFAVIALFVGSFIIANTFTMIVRESMRGYALLRSVGASPSQIYLTVLVQSVVLGIAGSAFGLLLGEGLLKLISEGMKASGTPLSAAADISIANALIGVTVGIAVSFIGSALPARRAAFAPPVSAMRENENPEKPVALRAVLGLIMIILGAGMWALAAYEGSYEGDGDATPYAFVNDLGTGWPLGIGAALVIIGVIVFMPAAVSFAGAVLGWIPAHIFTVSGRLASRNLMRMKRRTANTAAALFTGVAIVSCLGVVASSAKVSVLDLVDNGLSCDFSIRSASRQLNPEAVKAVESVEGIKSVNPVNMIVGVKYGNETIQGMTVTVKDTFFTDVLNPQIIDGDPVRSFSEDKIVIGEKLSKDHGWKVGDEIEAQGTKQEIDKEAMQTLQKQKTEEIQKLTAKIAARQTLTEEENKNLQADRQFMEFLQSMASGSGENLSESLSSADSSIISQLPLKNTNVSKKLTVGAIISNSIYSNAVFLPETAADGLSSRNGRAAIAAYIKSDGSVSEEIQKQRIVDSVKKYYVISVMNKEDLQSTFSSVINQILVILYALLALSIVIAIFGVVNTLTLSVIERVRELGLLRATGASKGQIRLMVGIEAAEISLFGTFVGVIVGVAAGVVIQKVFTGNGLDKLSIPYEQAGIFLVSSIFVGILASLPPSRKALKVSILDAVIDE